MRWRSLEATRLRWLNSQIGEDREPVTPFLPMKVNGNIIQATEKTFRIASNGLPASIEINGKQVLAKPFRFVVVTNDGDIAFDAEDAVLKKEAVGMFLGYHLMKKTGSILSVMLLWNMMAMCIMI